MTAANFFTNKRAAYANTGVWAKKAMAEAKRFGEAYEACTSADKNHSYIPQRLELKPDTSYLHIPPTTPFTVRNGRTSPMSTFRLSAICRATSFPAR